MSAITTVVSAIAISQIAFEATWKFLTICVVDAAETLPDILSELSFKT